MKLGHYELCVDLIPPHYSFCLRSYSIMSNGSSASCQPFTTVPSLLTMKYNPMTKSCLPLSPLSVATSIVQLQSQKATVVTFFYNTKYRTDPCLCTQEMESLYMQSWLFFVWFYCISVAKRSKSVWTVCVDQNQEVQALSLSVCMIKCSLLTAWNGTAGIHLLQHKSLTIFLFFILRDT